MRDRIETLDELLADPMVQLAIRSSRSRPDEVRNLMLQAGERAPKAGLPPAHVIAATAKHGWCCA